MKLTKARQNSYKKNLKNSIACAKSEGNAQVLEQLSQSMYNVSQDKENIMKIKSQINRFKKSTIENFLLKSEKVYTKTTRNEDEETKRIRECLSNEERQKIGLKLTPDTYHLLETITGENLSECINFYVELTLKTLKGNCRKFCTRVTRNN